MILELGLAAVTLHSNAAVCPSIIPYGLEVVDVTSGLYCTSISTITASDVPTVLLAVQLYDPDLFLFIFGIVKVGPP